MLSTGSVLNSPLEEYSDQGRREVDKFSTPAQAPPLKRGMCYIIVMNIIILDHKIDIEEVKKLADFWYGTMIKGTVDIELARVALGGDYHIESSEILTKSGSKFEDVWGFNIRFEENKDGVLEFDSMVNIKPNLDNRSRGINNEEVIKKATEIIHKFIDLK